MPQDEQEPQINIWEEETDSSFLGHTQEETDTGGEDG